MGDILPEVLRPGSVLLLKTGLPVKLVGTSKKDDYGQRLYRLHYPRHMDGKWMMPGGLGRDTYSRDNLQELGLKLAENPDCDKDEAIV